MPLAPIVKLDTRPAADLEEVAEDTPAEAAFTAAEEMDVGPTREVVIDPDPEAPAMALALVLEAEAEADMDEFDADTETDDMLEFDAEADIDELLALAVADADMTLVTAARFADPPPTVENGTHCEVAPAG